MYPEINRHNWLYAPHHRYGFQHVGEFVETAVVSRGNGPVRELLYNPNDLNHLAIKGGSGRNPIGANITFSNALDLTHTDAMLVLHKGRIAQELYFHDMQPETLHLLMSCTNSYIGVLLASGIHGQALYIDPVAEIVIAKFSSQPEARDNDTFNLQFALFETIAAYFAT